MNKLEFAKSLFPNLSWEDKNNHVEYLLNNSNKFSDLCSKLDGMSTVEEDDDSEQITLEGINLLYKGYDSTDSDSVFTIKAIGDFTKDEYRIEVW